MKIALFGINYGPCADPQAASQVARAAEAAGFESLWTGEHIVLPDPQVPPSPAAPETPFIDSLVALTFVAAHTTAIRLGTGIIILPQRNPVVLAKELASTDVLAGGRLIFGIGVGYLKPEFEAIGAPFDHKGARSEEFLARDDRAMDDGQAGVPRPLRLVRRRQCDAASGAEAPSGDRVWRPYQGSLLARGAPGHGMVRLCARPRDHQAARRGAQDRLQGSRTAFRGP